MYEFIQEHKKLLTISGIILLCFAFYMWGRSNVHDNGDTAEHAREQLERVGTEQQRAIDSIERIRNGLEDSERTVERVSERNREVDRAIESAESRVRAGATIVRDSQYRITECLISKVVCSTGRSLARAMISSSR